mmetsp:Transcript_33138/g.116305  ORF Transcript_33138/g.116305 Transcript_33138/m.116305 type:complete len:372 (-) Transcript_33138:988-2103(-)
MRPIAVLFCLWRWTLASPDEAEADAVLSEEATQRLVAEAERWRDGANRTRDLARAREMYELASARGTGRAARRSTFELAVLFEKGCGWPAIGDGAAPCAVERDVAKALELYGSAADRGHPGAQLAVAVALSSGAFVLGEAKEAEALARYGDTGGVSAERSEDVAVVHEYFAALGREPLAQMALGARHLHGRGVPARCDASLEYYEAAANAAVAALRREGVLRPNERARLSHEQAATTLRGIAGLDRAAAKVGRLAAAAETVVSAAMHGGMRIGVVRSIVARLGRGADGADVADVSVSAVPRAVDSAAQGAADANRRRRRAALCLSPQRGRGHPADGRGSKAGGGRPRGQSARRKGRRAAAGRAARAGGGPL